MISENRKRRDLDWCLHSAPLVTGNSPNAIWPTPEWFEALPSSIGSLQLPGPRHPHHFRLGQHFESTLAAWLTAEPGFELIAANLQVQDGKRTVGEFDFLVAVRDRVEHWEAAVKFYLGTGDGLALSCWFGPNTSDRFDAKYQRLIDHQLKLATDPHALALLESLGLTVSGSRCFMKGRLFHPWHRYTAGDFPVPEVVYPGHEKGWWLPASDFLAVFEDSGDRFVYLPKSLWLSRLTGADFDAPLSCWELADLLESPAAEQAVHVAIVAEDKEVSRGFIVKDQWLNRAS